MKYEASRAFYHFSTITSVRFYLSYEYTKASKCKEFVIMVVVIDGIT